MPLPSFDERMKLLLFEAASKLGGLGDEFNIGESRFLAATYSETLSDVEFLMQALVDKGLAKHASLDYAVSLTPLGYSQLYEWQSEIGGFKQGFVAMWFHDEMVEVYEAGLEEGIRRAGYESVRVDKVEHVNRIDDEIIRQINQSKFVVADFTGHRAGVYFEAGYALGKGLPVIWTCKKSDVDQLHFDIRQFNCIDWDEPADLAARLFARVEALLGPGPVKHKPNH